MRKEIYLIILFCIFSLGIIAQNKLAIIVDKDGFVNLRESANINSKIIDTIKQGDFVICDSLFNDWYKVTEFKWYKSGINYGNQINGFVHKSRVKLIQNFTIIEQQKLIIKTFNDYNKFIDDRCSWVKSHYDFQKRKWNDSSDSLKNLNYSEASFNIVDTKFDPILQYIETYYCKTQDISVLDKLFTILYNNQGSANEQPAWSLGACFICYPNPIIKSLKNMDKDKANVVKGQISFGLASRFHVNSEDSIQTNKDYLKYIKLLQ